MNDTSSLRPVRTSEPKPSVNGAHAEPVIRLSGLGKRYVLGHQGRIARGALREALTEGTRELARRLVGRGKPRESHEFWALRDLNLDIRRGEVVGVIGRNGAGKSTLLKLLSRVTEPTTGRIELVGRVASLLEVGTGFHQELTGRENLYLNGAILGMRRAEIRRKFDEIVAFAGVEEFLDTPVKRYSSGMYMRLAFSIAAHLSVDILIVDEVLAVGDAAFQRKCLGKMGELAGVDRTILFVSHNMSAVRQLCTRGVVLENGTLALDDTADAAIRHYTAQTSRMESLEGENLRNRLDRASGAVRFTGFHLGDATGADRTSFDSGETVVLRLPYKVYQAVPGIRFYLVLRDGLTHQIVTTVATNFASGPRHPGEEGTLVVTFPDVPLRAGDYSLYIWMGDFEERTSYDTIDHVNVTLPYLSINSSDKPDEPKHGYFSIPWQLRSE